MKKILLVLFLMLGAVSLAAPSRVNVAKIQNDGGIVLIDKSNAYSFIKLIDENSLLAVTYYVGELEKGGIKTVSESLKNQQLANGIEYISSGETETGYIHKLYAVEQGYYFYIVIGKNQKIKNYVVTGILQTAEEYSSKNDLKAIIELAVKEGERYLK